MNPIDEGIIGIRIAKIRDCAQQLKILISVPRSEFIQSAIHGAAAERNLQIAIQAMLDIGAYILAKKGKRKPEDYKGIFQELGKSGLLPADFAKKIEGLAGLRNILVHEYAEVDPGRLYDDIKNDLDDFEKFAAAMVKISTSL